MPAATTTSCIQVTNPGESIWSVYRPGETASENAPSASVFAVIGRGTLGAVAALSVTDAPTTTPPCGSVTVPATGTV
jgi:hypothetical protein